MTPKSQQKTIRILGVPLDLGQTHRGVDMGPGAVRYAGLASRLLRLGLVVKDGGNIDVPIRGTLPDDHKATLLDAISKASATVYEQARATVGCGETPIFIGGDHSVAIGTVGGLTHDRSCGVIWIDAHADFNTPATSRTGNVHGMSLAVLTGHGSPELVDIGRPGAKITPDRIALVGLRDLDRQERLMLQHSGITVYTMRDVDERGISLICHEIIDRFKDLDSLHISLDLDAIDPAAAPGVGTPVAGGLTVREAHLLMEILADSNRVGSLDLVEINPILDQRNQTGQLAADLAVSLFGKSIL